MTVTTCFDLEHHQSILSDLSSRGLCLFQWIRLAKYAAEGDVTKGYIALELELKEVL